MWTRWRRRGSAVRSSSRSVIAMLLLISGIQPNPGPFRKLIAKPKRIKQWTVWNINEVFNYASVGADAGFATHVERLLKLYRLESLAAANLCEAYQRISRQWSHEKEVAGSKLDGEKYEVDQAKIGVQSAVAKSRKYWKMHLRQK